MSPKDKEQETIICFPSSWFSVNPTSIKLTADTLKFPFDNDLFWPKVWPPASVKSRFLVIERRRPNHRIHFSVAQHASSRRSRCMSRTCRVLAYFRQYHARSSTVLKPLYSQSSLLSIPLHYKSIFIARFSFHSFMHLNTSFNSLTRNAVAILLRSIIAPPMLCHHSTRKRCMLCRNTFVTPPYLDQDSTDARL